MIGSVNDTYSLWLCYSPGALMFLVRFLGADELGYRVIKFSVGGVTIGEGGRSYEQPVHLLGALIQAYLLLHVRQLPLQHTHYITRLHLCYYKRICVLCVCVLRVCRVCVHACLYLCGWACMRVCMCVHAWVHVRGCVYTYNRACLCACTCAHISAYNRTHVYACGRIHKCADTWSELHSCSVTLLLASDCCSWILSRLSSALLDWSSSSCVCLWLSYADKT